jgi:hypothetical protein
LTVDFSGPNLPHLSLVDLPGRVSSFAKDSDVIKEIINTHTSGNRTAILVLHRAGDDFANSEILASMRELNRLDQCFLVISKIDESNPEWFESQMEQITSFRFGASGVYCLDDGREDAINQNFSRVANAKLQFGVEKLGKKLTEILDGIQKENISFFKSQLDAEFGRIVNELSILPNDIPQIRLNLISQSVIKLFETHFFGGDVSALGSTAGNRLMTYLCKDMVTALSEIPAKIQNMDHTNLQRLQGNLNGVSNVFSLGNRHVILQVLKNQTSNLGDIGIIAEEMIQESSKIFLSVFKEASEVGLLKDFPQLQVLCSDLVNTILDRQVSALRANCQIAIAEAEIFFSSTPEEYSGRNDSEKLANYLRGRFITPLADSFGRKTIYFIVNMGIKRLQEELMYKITDQAFISACQESPELTNQRLRLCRTRDILFQCITGIQ